MQLVFEFLLNIFVMGKPDEKDKKWIPILVIAVLLLVVFTMSYNIVN